MKTSPNGEKLLNFVADKFENGHLTNDDLVQLIELSGGYLNLTTIPNYARSRKLSYNGVKKCRRVVEIFKVKFVIDNL